jgi:hypothetical protein
VRAAEPLPNRANAQKSTGPRTDAGKGVSRMNAVKHGLLAQAVVITAGDYQEDEQAFTQLLESPREEFMPVGAAEDQEVEMIAYCYWHKMRAARYEHGAIRKRTSNSLGTGATSSEARGRSNISSAYWNRPRGSSATGGWTGSVSSG